MWRLKVPNLYINSLLPLRPKSQSLMMRISIISFRTKFMVGTIYDLESKRLENSEFFSEIGGKNGISSQKHRFGGFGIFLNGSVQVKKIVKINPEEMIWFFQVAKMRSPDVNRLVKIQKFTISRNIENQRLIPSFYQSAAFKRVIVRRLSAKYQRANG